MLSARPMQERRSPVVPNQVGTPPRIGESEHRPMSVGPWLQSMSLHSLVVKALGVVLVDIAPRRADH